MLTNFESITKDITKKERAEILPLVISSLSRRAGKEHTVTNKQLIKWLAISNIKTNEIRIRKIIHVIHVEGLVKRLMATSKGYFVTTDIEEYKKYIESREQRERNIHLATKACRQYLKEWESNNVHQMQLEM